MQIIIKIASRPYQQLRDAIPADSIAREAIEKASRIDHSLEGVLFAGYTITCNHDQAQIIRQLATRCCPEIIPTVEQALTLARPG
jgi:hypothetical protein